MTTTEEKELLAKMEEVNRSLQMDSKSIQSLSIISRHNSITSDLNMTATIDEDKISLSSAHCSSPNFSSNNRFIEKWTAIINNWSQYTRRKSQVKDLIKQSSGIPYHYRPLVWQLMCSCSDENPAAAQLKAKYPEYLKQQSPCEKAIRRDIARTYPQHELFKDPEGDGQERLFKIMKAYSIHDREVGYCQGSGFIGGLLLIHMPEEDAFAVLVSLMFDFQLRNLYKPNMSELGLCMYQMDCMVEEHLPKLALHFRSHNFQATVYASGWFLTLFTLPFSIELASRIMDLFMVEGIDIIYKIAIAYLTLYQDELLKMDMESMLRFLQYVGPQQLESESTRLFEVVVQIKLNTRKMKKVEKEYLALKIEEEDNQVELRRLRTENGLLLQRIDRLEKESENLTQNLVSKNLIVAEQNAYIIQIKNDMTESRRIMDHLKKNLTGTESQLQLAVGQLNGRISDGDVKDSGCDRKFVCNSTDLVQQLQTQLVNIRLKEAETNASYRELKDKYRELDDMNRMLSKTPTEEVAKLQEDLVVMKLREAETSLSLRDTQKRLAELNRLWNTHVNKCASVSSLTSYQNDSKRDRNSLHDLTDISNDVMLFARKLVEAEYAVELSSARQKIMEQQAQQEIINRQISRRDEELIYIKEKLDEHSAIQKELRNELKESDRRCVDLEAKRKEDFMMWKIQKMEMESVIAELKQKVAQMEIQREEISTSSQMGYRKQTSSPNESSRSSLERSFSQSVHNKWKDLPRNIMTESIGPLDELCFTPDDPMITSIYINPDDGGLMKTAVVHRENTTSSPQLSSGRASTIGGHSIDERSHGLHGLNSADNSDVDGA